MTAENLDCSGVGVQQSFADLDRRRLSGAVRSEQTEALAGANVEIERLDGDDIGVGLSETADRERQRRGR